LCLRESHWSPCAQDTNIDVIHHHGSTDQLVAADMLKFHGVVGLYKTQAKVS
jgi:hypothetical protein